MFQPLIYDYMAFRVKCEIHFLKSKHQKFNTFKPQFMCPSLEFKQSFGAKKSDRRVDIYSPFISSLDSFEIHDLVISRQRFDLCDLSSVTLCGDQDPDPFLVANGLSSNSSSLSLS